LTMGDRIDLTGKSVLITRPAGRGADLIAELKNRGADVTHRPAIRFEPAGNRAKILETVRSLKRYRWIVLTSPTAVRFFLDAVRESGTPIDANGPWFAVPGEGSANALRAGGLEPRLVAREADAESLGVEMAQGDLTGVPVLWPRAESARSALREKLHEAAADLAEIVLYRTVPCSACASIQAELHEGRYGAVLYSSPSSFRSLLEAVPDLPATLPESVKCIAIGEVTAAAIRSAGGRVDQVAIDPGKAAILSAIETAFSP
jgi:uroporphyrinogen-III synthase